MNNVRRPLTTIIDGAIIKIDYSRPAKTIVKEMKPVTESISREASQAYESIGRYEARVARSSSRGGIRKTSDGGYIAIDNRQPVKPQVQETSTRGGVYRTSDGAYIAVDNK